VPLLESSIALFEDVELAGRTFTLQKTAALNYLGAVEHHCGRFEEAVRIYEECAARCEKEGMLRGGCLFHSNAAHAAYDRGDRALMARHLQSARGVFEDCLWWRGNAVCFSLTALLAGEEGDEEDALAFLRKADALCIPLRKRQWLALQLWVRGF
jgi:tetratricopeptide (TPR) repeat protein